MLRISIAERHRELGGATANAVLAWVESYRRRFRSLARRVLAGEVAHIRPFRPTASRPPRPAPSATDVRLPAMFGWMCRLVPCRAAGSGNGLAQMLTTDTEFMALVSSDPRFGRLIRPLLWATGQRRVPPCVPPPMPRRRITPRVTKPSTAKSGCAPRPVKPVTGRALQKYLPWKRPRPLPAIKTRGAEMPDGERKSKA